MCWRSDGEKFTQDAVAKQLDAADRREQLEWLLQALRQLVAFVRELHAQDLVHRDLKPSNVVLERATWLLKIVDWGASSLAEPALSLLMPYGGTVHFSSPTQLYQSLRMFDFALCSSVFGFWFLLLFPPDRLQCHPQCSRVLVFVSSR